MSEENPKDEQQFISLLLNNTDLVEDFKQSPLNMEHFDPTHRMILHAVQRSSREGLQGHAQVFH
jgi:hypothetical protein